MPNCVSTVFGISWARSASPYAFASSTRAAALDVHDAREARAPGECVDGFGERRHQAGDRIAAGRAQPGTVYATASGGSSRM